MKTIFFFSRLLFCITLSISAIGCSSKQETGADLLAEKTLKLAVGKIRLVLRNEKSEPLSAVQVRVSTSRYAEIEKTNTRGEALFTSKFILEEPIVFEFSSPTLNTVSTLARYPGGRDYIQANFKTTPQGTVTLDSIEY